MADRVIVIKDVFEAGQKVLAKVGGDHSDPNTRVDGTGINCKYFDLEPDEPCPSCFLGYVLDELKLKDQIVSLYLNSEPISEVVAALEGEGITFDAEVKAYLYKAQDFNDRGAPWQVVHQEACEAANYVWDRDNEGPSYPDE
jgi:hypothetical protein